LIALTKILAKELAPSIRVCAIAPGVILIDPSEKEKALKKVLLKKMGNPEDIAEACFFIYKNNYITGTVLYIDGGRSIYG
ncbi:MAG: SDR family oxidoreductase, partial [candidate division WOR-3 bacterium]